MRQRLLLWMLLLAVVVGVPVAVAAQGGQAVWELDENLTFTDLGFNINYPADWEFGATESSGVFFAETEDDLDQVTDSDPNTMGTDNTMQFIGTRIEDLAGVIGSDDPTLEEIADFVVQSRGITENEARVEIPVMTRRSLSVLGQDAADQGWILTIWKQNGYAIGAFLTSPSYEETVRIAFSWGQLIGGIRPNDPLPLGKETVSLPNIKAEFAYPDGWIVDPENPNIVYELESDLENQTNNGSFLLVTEQKLPDTDMDLEQALDEVVTSTISSLGLVEPIRREEFILLGQPAVAIRGTNENEIEYALVIQTIVNGAIVRIGLISPSESDIDALEPSFIYMLQSLRTTES